MFTNPIDISETNFKRLFESKHTIKSYGDYFIKG